MVLLDRSDAFAITGRSVLPERNPGHWGIGSAGRIFLCLVEVNLNVHFHSGRWGLDGKLRFFTFGCMLTCSLSLRSFATIANGSAPDMLHWRSDSCEGEASKER